MVIFAPHITPLMGSLFVWSYFRITFPLSNVSIFRIWAYPLENKLHDNVYLWIERGAVALYGGHYKKIVSELERHLFLEY